MHVFWAAKWEVESVGSILVPPMVVENTRPYYNTSEFTCIIVWFIVFNYTSSDRPTSFTCFYITISVLSCRITLMEMSRWLRSAPSWLTSGVNTICVSMIVALFIACVSRLQAKHLYSVVITIVQGQGQGHEWQYSCDKRKNPTNLAYMTSS